MIGRTNTGGGGGLQDTDALLRVQAPAGSVVTITKGGMTKTDHGHENALEPTVYDYYFIIHQSQFDSVNPWTVTAVLGATTYTDSVIIDSADEYDIQLSWDGVIFSLYDEHIEVTGGWEWASPPFGVSLNQSTGQLQISRSGSYAQPEPRTKNFVEALRFNTLEFKVRSSSSAQTNLDVSVVDENLGQIATLPLITVPTTMTVYTIDISAAHTNIRAMFTPLANLTHYFEYIKLY